MEKRKQYFSEEISKINADIDAIHKKVISQKSLLIATVYDHDSVIFDDDDGDN